MTDPTEAAVDPSLDSNLAPGEAPPDITNINPLFLTEQPTEAELFQERLRTQVDHNRMSMSMQRDIQRGWMSENNAQMEHAARLFGAFNPLYREHFIKAFTDMPQFAKETLMVTLGQMEDQGRSTDFGTAQRRAFDEVESRLEERGRKESDLRQKWKMFSDFDMYMEATTTTADGETVGTGKPALHPVDKRPYLTPKFTELVLKKTRQLLSGGDDESSPTSLGSDYISAGGVFDEVGPFASSNFKRDLEDAFRKAPGDIARFGMGGDDIFLPNMLQYLDDNMIKDEDRQHVPPAFASWWLEYQRVAAHEYSSHGNWTRAIRQAFQETLISGPYGFEYREFAGGNSRVFRRWPMTIYPEIEGVSGRVYLQEFVTNQYLTVLTEAGSVDEVMKNFVNEQGSFFIPTDWDPEKGRLGKSWDDFIDHFFTPSQGITGYNMFYHPINTASNIYGWALNLHYRADRIRRGFETLGGGKTKDKQAANYLFGLYYNLLGLSVPQNHRFMLSVLGIPFVDHHIELMTGERIVVKTEEEADKIMAENKGSYTKHSTRILRDGMWELDRAQEGQLDTQPAPFILIPTEVTGEINKDLRSSPNGAQKYLKELNRIQGAHTLRLQPARTWDPLRNNYDSNWSARNTDSRAWELGYEVLADNSRSINPITVDAVAWATENSVAVRRARAANARKQFVNDAVQQGFTRRGLSIPERFATLDEDQRKHLRSDPSAVSSLAKKLTKTEWPPSIPRYMALADPFYEKIHAEMTAFLADD